MSASWAYQAPRALSPEQLERWSQLVETRTGIDLSQHASIISRSVNSRLRELGRDDADAYFDEVANWPAGLPEWSRLLDCLTVQETRFFRQREAFELVHRFLRHRLGAWRPGQTLDLWSVGCATGEEAWSLAMVAREAMRREPAAKTYCGVMATDISQGALAQAREGHYPEARAVTVPARLRERYLQQRGDGRWSVVRELRDALCFARGNVLMFQELPPFPMDVIFCQNVLIYFRRERREAALNALAGRLKPGGLLVVGPGEAAQWRHEGLQRARCDQVHAYLRRGHAAAGRAGTADASGTDASGTTAAPRTIRNRV